VGEDTGSSVPSTGWHHGYVWMRLFIAVLSVAVAGCAPTLRNDGGPDDDDATANDDDATANDDDSFPDDDDSFPDDDDSFPDDDDIGFNCSRSAGFMELWSSVGPSVEGTWFDGDVDIQPGLVTVIDAVGQVVEFNSSFLEEVDGFLPGPGRVYWQTPGNTPWNQDAVLGVELWEPIPVRLVMANMAVPNEELSEAFDVWVQPRTEACDDPQEVECGVVRGLPLFFFSQYGDGTSDEVWLGSGDTMRTQWAAFMHLGGQVFDEIICPDTPELEYAWVWGSAFDESVLGIR